MKLIQYHIYLKTKWTLIDLQSIFSTNYEIDYNFTSSGIKFSTSSLMQIPIGSLKIFYNIFKFSHVFWGKLVIYFSIAAVCDVTLFFWVLISQLLMFLIPSSDCMFVEFIISYNCYIVSKTKTSYEKNKIIMSSSVW